VLTGIDEALPTRELRDAYTGSIRLISTVSGGGVGAMYFSEKYDENGKVDHDRLHDVLAKAEASSLDDVAWGAVYPDLIGSLFPPVRLWLGDRGQALEKAWTRDRPDSGRRGVGALMADWREQVWAATRPANIFNATLVDTGERLLLGTTRVGWHEEHGLHNYEDLYGDRNVQVVTAARLAASFTYVSPAARPDRADCDGRPQHLRMVALPHGLQSPAAVATTAGQLIADRIESCSDLINCFGYCVVLHQLVRI